MNIGDLDPIVQCEILRLSHDYADKIREEIRRNRRVPESGKKCYADSIKAATESILSLYKQRASNQGAF